MTTPSNLKQEAIALVSRPMRTKSEEDIIVKRLMEIYLQYEEPHQYTTSHRLWGITFSRWFSCGRCRNKVLEFFEEMAEQTRG